MTNFLRVVAMGLGCVTAVTGCSGEDGSSPALAPVTGSVTYNGGPLAGATVTFMPGNGPLAMAVTDLKGEFKLNSGALPGCTIGPAKVAVSAIPPGEGSSNPAPTFNSSAAMSPAEMQEASKKMAEATQNYQASGGAAKTKSLIPARYKDVATSGLSYTVDKDGAKNVFKIELKD
jgi:hypothetical protein